MPKRFSIIVIAISFFIYGCHKDNPVAPAIAPIPGIQGDIYALAVYNGNLIAGGYITMANTTPVNNIAQWNGSQWTALGSGLKNSVSALITYKGNLIAACPNIGVFQWNGNNWTQLVSLKCQKYLFTIYNGNLVVGGTFDSIGGIKANNLAQWNGSAWSAIDTGSNGFISITTYKGYLVVSGEGSLIEMGGKNYNLIAKWNGTSWSSLGTGITYESNPVLFTNDTTLYVGGVSGYYVLVDSNWVSVTVAPSSGYTSNYIVDFCSYNGNTLTALYSYELGPNSAGCSLIKCDGTSYSSFLSNDNYTTGTINAMIQYQNNLIIAGNFAMIGNTSVLNIAQWNGTTWSAF